MITKFVPIYGSARQSESIIVDYIRVEYTLTLGTEEAL